MDIWISLAVSLGALCLLLLDATGVLDLLRPVGLFFYLPIAMNAIGIYALLIAAGYFSGIVPILSGVLFAVLLLYLGVRLQIVPARAKPDIPNRLRALNGGARLLGASLYASVFQTGFSVWVIVKMVQKQLPLLPWIFDLVLAAGLLLLLFFNGLLRVLILSRRLSVTRRVLTALFLWIPGINLVLCAGTCRIVRQEYAYLCEKEALLRTRPENTLCATRYPLLLVHGIGFRDFRFWNYWGRIPQTLKKNGAVLFYGNQEALGTAADNAADIKARIFAILKETGAEKVNIIAHSKGGLDARYAISRLGMAPYIASLTTISTPHRGCRFVDSACKLPDGFYRFVAGLFDRTFRRFGDRSPDFYTATRQFSTAYSAKFNAETPDDPGVYYQSYASVMRAWYSDLLLAVPYLLAKASEGANDGLVSVESAKWGHFEGTFQNCRARGISHGDIIDLKRQDYREFDVQEAYVSIVSALKKRGF